MPRTRFLHNSTVAAECRKRLWKLVLCNVKKRRWCCYPRRVCVCVTDRQIDQHVGAVQQRHSTTQSLSGRRHRRRRHSRRRASAARSTCPPGTDESYQSRHRVTRSRQTTTVTLSVSSLTCSPVLHDTESINSRCIQPHALYLPGVIAAGQSAAPPYCYLHSRVKPYATLSPAAH